LSTGSKTRYVIAGNGAAGIAAVESIRSIDRENPICVVSAEPGPAYSRVLLHHMVAGEIPESTLTIRGHRFYGEMGVDLIHGVVERVDASAQRVHLEGGRSLDYDSLLVASGAMAWKPPVPGVDLPNVHCLWTVEDARALTALAHESRTAVVMGAGFVGIQAADALASRGVDVTLVEVADRVLPLLVDGTGAAIVHEHLRGKGVSLRLGTSVAAIDGLDGGSRRVDLSDGNSINANAVVVATGARPNVKFLNDSQVEMARGVVVDAAMRTSAPNLYAAGDVTISRDLVTGKPANCAIWPVAVEQGAVAGLNMAGRDARHLGSLRINVTSALGLSVGSVGLTEDGDDVQSDVFQDSRRRIYRRLFFRGHALVGAMLVGDTSDLGILGSLVRGQANVSPWRDRIVTDCLTYPHVFSLLRPMRWKS
jgi:NAD(P)H-nitrite reductase large subunit